MASVLRLLAAPAFTAALHSAPSCFRLTMQRSLASTSEQDIRKEINKAMYRAKQRGLLELDLLIGIFAERNVPNMSAERLVETQKLLKEENVDLFQWLTQQSEAPEHVQQNSVFQEIAQSVRDLYSTKCPQEARASSDAQWVHGWQDKPANSS
eukprot:jgi/Ulvmu1/7681/UM038_0112.1